MHLEGDTWRVHLEGCHLKATLGGWTWRHTWKGHLEGALGEATWRRRLEETPGGVPGRGHLEGDSGGELLLPKHSPALPWGLGLLQEPASQRK